MRRPEDPEWSEQNDPEIVDWKRVCESIEHENNLTNHRLTWLLTSQGFLFAAFVLVFQASTKNDVVPEHKDFYKFVLSGLMLTGIVIAAYLRFLLQAAQKQHDVLRDWWKARVPGADRASRHPPVCGTGFGWFTDKLPAGAFPFVFVAAWVGFVPVVL